MGIGLAVGIVLIAKVFFELSYDSFYKDIGRVYTIRNLVQMCRSFRDNVPTFRELWVTSLTQVRNMLSPVKDFRDSRGISGRKNAIIEATSRVAGATVPAFGFSFRIANPKITERADAVGGAL